MKLKSLNLNRFLRQILPSIFFIACIVGYLYASPFSAINLIAIVFILLLLSNIFLQRRIIDQILGGIFLFSSFFMIFPLLSDVLNEKATLDYLMGLFLILSGIIMSILLILGYDHKA